MSMMPRNLHVESAVSEILRKVDLFINGAEVVDLPDRDIRSSLESFFSKNGGSVKLACLFFLSYSLMDPSWDKKSIPVGTRGKYGDKRLSSELTDRYVTFHKNITAFGENLGTKGNVRNFDLSSDPRFSDFIGYLSLPKKNRLVMFDYICSQLSESRIVPRALPNLPANYLTYAKSVSLLNSLISIPSEGHIQQFLVAAILKRHRVRYGVDIVTHHPHASDKFDKTYGDIEEFLDGTLLNAYEVTVREDWKNRIPDLRSKMREAGLQKYILIASNINSDDALSSPELLLDLATSLGLIWQLSICQIL